MTGHISWNLLKEFPKLTDALKEIEKLRTELRFSMAMEKAAIEEYALIANYMEDVVPKVGTNYYALRNRCDCCGRSEQIHIGKSFRLLRAYDKYSPTGKIECWDDWLLFLASENILIEDEYGDIIDKESFISKWVPIPGMADKIYEENREWGLQYGTSLGVYLDKQGYKFSTREFS